MRLGFHPEAQLELREAVAFYENSRNGLGVAFAGEVASALKRIIEAPDRYTFLEKDVRRCLGRRFPHAILYTVEVDFILIIAVMHCSRKPDFWRNRLPE